MSLNRKKFLTVSVNSQAKRQTSLDTPLADADFDKRIKVAVEVTDAVGVDEERDCSDVDLVDKTVETQLKQADWTFSKITAFWISYYLAFFLGAAGEPATVGGKQVHPLTRSLSDDLPATGFVDCFEDDLATAEKYSGQKVNSLDIQLPRRKNVTMTMQTIGRFTTSAISGFDLPDCETLPALKGWQCKVLIGGVDYTELVWLIGISMNNNCPTTGDENYPNTSSADIKIIERGDQPTYTLKLQMLIRKGHALWTAAKNRTKVAVVIELGNDDKCVLTFPNTYLELDPKWRQFVSESNTYSTVINGTPMKDAALKTPLKADAHLETETQFLLT